MLLDLSNAIENDLPVDPPGLGRGIEYQDHAFGAQEMTAMFPGLKPGDLPDGEGLLPSGCHHGP